MWDVRQSAPVTHMSGPYVVGDGVEFDTAGNQLLVAAYHKPNTLHSFDLRTRKLLWSAYGESDPCALYDCKVSGERGMNTKCRVQQRQDLPSLTEMNFLFSTFFCFLSFSLSFGSGILSPSFSFPPSSNPIWLSYYVSACILLRCSYT